jgi:hypothetical protein
MIYESQYLRIWKADDQLMSLLPNERRAPLHEDYQNRAIGVAAKHGLDYVTAVTCDWHNDWPEVFEYLVVRGTARLRFGTEPCYKHEANHEPKQFTMHRLERGHVIQLWPMVPHQVIILGSIAMLSNEVDPWGKGNDKLFNGFGEPKHLETYFKTLILERYKIGRRKKIVLT